MRNPFYDTYGPTGLGIFAVIVGGTVAIMAFVFGLTAGVIYAIDRPSCEKSLDRLDLEGDWGFWTGCVAEVDGRPIPLDQFFVNEEANE